MWSWFAQKILPRDPARSGGFLDRDVKETAPVPGALEPF
jgi:hypothetical protein